MALSTATPPLRALSRPLRILMVAPTSFFADYGCHVRILEESRYLQSQGHLVTICTYSTGRDLDDLTIHRAKGVPWRTTYEVGSSRHKIAMDALLGLRALRSMREVRPDIIHAHIHEGALIGLALARMCKCPLVCDLQGSMTAEMVDHHFVRNRSGAFRMFRRIEAFIVHRSERILTSTALNARLLMNEFGCAAERIVHVPDCVNTEVFSPQPHDAQWEAYRASLRIPAGRKVIVYLGLLAKYQGTDLLLRTAAALCRQRDDLHFVLAGFPNVEHYGRMAEQLSIGDHCSFPGKVPYEQAPRLLSQGDVAVSPKLSATEGAGKILNYMAMALPTVAFETPVSREYLSDLGSYARLADTDDLARRLEEAVDNPDRDSLGARLRQRAQDQYDWSRSGELILGAYADQIGRSALGI
jgi:glycosyltransferase involved in cell wall biosynthesis